VAPLWGLLRTLVCVCVCVCDGRGKQNDVVGVNNPERGYHSQGSRRQAPPANHISNVVVFFFSAENAFKPSNHDNHTPMHVNNVLICAASQRFYINPDHLFQLYCFSSSLLWTEVHSEIYMHL